MADKKRLNEVFEHVTGVNPSISEAIPESNWTAGTIGEFLDTVGQEQYKMLDRNSGVSSGDFGRVKFRVQNNTLYLDFQTPEMAHMAINNMSNAASNPYEFSSRFDQMPNTVMVQFTDSGINEGDLAYMHVNDAGPETDQYQIGTEIVPDTLPESEVPSVNSTQGKSELLLQKEMNDIFTSAGLNARLSLERKRGRAGLVVPSNEIEKATELFLQKHPDFKFSYENPPHGDTHFLYFNQVVPF